MNYCLRWSVIFTCAMFAVLFSMAQNPKRYEIDAKRGDMSYTSKDALTSGREFKRIDSSYYVGWMFEGLFKYEKASDYLGFKNASISLQRAVELLQRDFSKELKTRTGNVMDYIPVMQRHRDWDYVAHALMQCYSNMEAPDKVWDLLQRCKKMDLQDELYMDTYNYMAWTVHRNRFYTKDKYQFLKNSIPDNELYANSLLDSMAIKIKRDAALNRTIFASNYESEKMPGVWHYKSILYSYQLNTESAAYYYNKLRATPYFPANNYATFCAIQAKFREAEFYYKQSKKEESGDKRMKESYYYSSIINNYKGSPKDGIDETNQLLKANGSTPGYGWYNIALARNFIYDGQLTMAKIYSKRAEEFKEIHIGTTLGQSHYDFSVSLMNLVIKMREIRALKFEDKNWYYRPSCWYKWVKLQFEKFGLQFLIINQLASNPERDQVIYKLFSTESTVSFDEIFYLIDGFSTNYFLKKFERELSQDKRKDVQRYFKYFIAKLRIKKGEYTQAKDILLSIQTIPTIDIEYERLFMARVVEALIECYVELDSDMNLDSQVATLYDLYPQLIPFSRIRIKAQLIHNASTEKQLDLVSKIKQTNIEWTENGKASVQYLVNFKKGSNGTELVSCQLLKDGKIISEAKEFVISNEIDITQTLQYHVFNCGSFEHDKELAEAQKEKSGG